MDTVNKHLTPEQVEGLKQFEADRAEIIARVMSKYRLVNGKLVKIQLTKTRTKS